MTEDPAPSPSQKITDRELVRLVMRGVQEMSSDPTVAELYKRIQLREEMEEDREHRGRSNKSAILGIWVGLTLLLIFIVGTIATFHP